ncbi:hypothetical protein F0Q45_24450 [Mycobacterium simiae]|uniref:Lipoprotein LpqS n=1 Tax=Mycobacterium simiae TaxID=1784 RepID=A0A5B1B983_MYCSI|nr:hypothetical protein [Mycobacterium simiae]KAA1245098.1 hypothetical protein F0Q45_24450 [Mycobacterium simiae]
MRFVGAAGTSRLRYVVAVASVAWMALWVVVIGAHNELFHSESPVPHPAHALATSLGAEFAINVDHPHVSKHSSSAHPEQFMTAVLPRSASTVLAVGVVTVMAAAGAGWLIHHVVPAGRGPPVGPAAVLAGRDILVRFCLSCR